MSGERSALAGEALARRADAVVSPSIRLRFPPVDITGGKGCHFWNAAGDEYLDLHAMAGVMNVGYGDPRVVGAVSEQAARLIHCNSAYVTHESMVTLAEALVGLVPGDGPRQVAFGLSGSDANDGAIKLARAATGRPTVIAFERAYHGCTYGALSASGLTPKMRRGFGPAVPDIARAPFPDSYRSPIGEDPVRTGQWCLGEIRRMLEHEIEPAELAGIVVEPVQGDSGILVPPEGFLAGLREICDQTGALLVFDEVQTGMGRTGAMFASEGLGAVPDIMVLGKALGGGMPVSAVVASAEVMAAWVSPAHVFSTAASPVSVAGALAVLEVLRADGLVERARARGERFMARFAELSQQFDRVGDVRGVGLMIGVDLVRDRHSREPDQLLAAKTVWGCLRRGCYLTSLAGSVLRIEPPLVITDGEVDDAVEIIRESLTDALAGNVADSVVERYLGW
ncbi:MAG: aspartate aminotransferase family protein [Actinomycetia bacterium]|nr:aspartate aminotransferase family protein [Actinomycetes bacterium]